MIERFGLGLVVALLMASGAAAMESYTRGEVEVREKAGAASPVLATLPGGTKVTLLRCEAGWCLIDEPDPDGWVREDSLELRGGGV
jgi:SH3-like domain-containing protein